MTFISGFSPPLAFFEGGLPAEKRPFVVSPPRRAFPSEHLSHRQVMGALEKEPKERKDPCSAAWLSLADCRRSATIELPLVVFCQ